MRNSRHTIVFAAILGLACSLMLVVANLFTAPYRSANERAEEIKNFLYALEVPVEPGSNSKTLLDIFNKNVRVTKRGNFDFYEYVPDTDSSEQPIAVAVQFSGAGLWGPIKGILALDPDLITIRNIRFYQQEETPGLGGEIGSDWFQDQFKGKEIVSGSGTPGFRVLRQADVPRKNSVDAITGATMTSNRVQVILDNLAKELSTVRNKYVQ